MKLFKVVFRNSKWVYVGAEDAGKAYEKARQFWDDNDWYCGRERELMNVELLAESEKYTKIEIHYIP